MTDRDSLLERLGKDREIGEALERVAAERPGVADVFLELFAERPALEPVAAPLFLTYRLITRCFDEGGMQARKR